METEIKSGPSQPGHSRPLVSGAALETSDREGCAAWAPRSAGAQAAETLRAAGVVTAQALKVPEKPRACEAAVRRRGASPLRARVTRLHTLVLVLVGAPKASIGFPVPGITNRRRGDHYCFGKGCGGGGRRGRVERAGRGSGILPMGPRA